MPKFEAFDLAQTQPHIVDTHYPASPWGLSPISNLLLSLSSVPALILEAATGALIGFNQDRIHRDTFSGRSLARKPAPKQPVTADVRGAVVGGTPGTA
jgi:hypothetical protein